MLSVGICLPFLRNGEFEIEARLQIRLIKAREGQMRTGRRKQRIHRIRISVQGSVADVKDNLQTVFSDCKKFFRNNDVSVEDVHADGPAARGNRVNRVPARLEVENEGPRRIAQRKINSLSSENCL